MVVLTPGKHLRTQKACYLIRKALGSGGFAQVYLAEDLSQQRLVALKVSKDIKTLAHEAAIHQQITRLPGVPQCYASWCTRRVAYLAMEYLAGETLAAWLLRIAREDQGVPLVQALWMAWRLCAVVSQLHRHLIVHRDLTPANVIVTDKQVWLIDLGLAVQISAEKPCMLDEVAGTPGYLAPEYEQSGYVSPQGDIYALGRILYQLLTGFLFPRCTCKRVPCTCVQCLSLRGTLGARITQMLAFAWDDRPASVEGITPLLLEAHKTLLQLEDVSEDAADEYVRALISW